MVPFTFRRRRTLGLFICSLCIVDAHRSLYFSYGATHHKHNRHILADFRGHPGPASSARAAVDTAQPQRTPSSPCACSAAGSCVPGLVPRIWRLTLLRRGVGRGGPHGGACREFGVVGPRAPPRARSTTSRTPPPSACRYLPCTVCMVRHVSERYVNMMVVGITTVVGWTDRETLTVVGSTSLTVRHTQRYLEVRISFRVML
jgi:hypothetical protein